MKINTMIIVEKGVIKMSSVTAAEAVKVFKGVYRDVNIALANELALLSEKLNLNIYEIIEAANSEPYCHIHLPGAGAGGHCIPVYPHFLIEIAQKYGVSFELIKTGRSINMQMCHHVVSRIIQGSNMLGKCLKGSKIALLGLSYRGNVKEHRYSPTIDVINYLLQYEPDIVLNDLLYTKNEIKSIVNVSFENDLTKAIKDADCIFILADHYAYKDGLIELIEQNDNSNVLLLDTKNLTNVSSFQNGIVLGIGKNN